MSFAVNCNTKDISVSLFDGEISLERLKPESSVVLKGTLIDNSMLIYMDTETFFNQIIYDRKCRFHYNKQLNLLSMGNELSKEEMSKMDLAAAYAGTDEFDDNIKQDIYEAVMYGLNNAHLIKDNKPTLFGGWLNNVIKKYDKIFVPTNDNDFDFIIMHKESIFRRKEQIPIKQLSNVIVLTEDEFNLIKSDYEIMLKALGELD